MHYGGCRHSFNKHHKTKDHLARIEDEIPSRTSNNFDQFKKICGGAKVLQVAQAKISPVVLASI